MTAFIAAPHDLHVLTYGGGWTGWLLRVGDAPLAAVLAPGALDSLGGRLTAGDMLTITGECGVAQVAISEAGDRVHVEALADVRGLLP